MKFNMEEQKAINAAACLPLTHKAPDPTFDIEQVTCKNCIKKYKRENK